jgi:hypothetical protein
LHVIEHVDVGLLDEHEEKKTQTQLTIYKRKYRALPTVETLLDVEVRRRLIEHVDVSFLNENNADGKALQLSTTQVLDFTVLNIDEIETLERLLAHVTVCCVV